MALPLILLELQDFLKLRTFAPEIEKERGDDCHSRAAELRNSLSCLMALCRNPRNHENDKCRVIL